MLPLTAKKYKNRNSINSLQMKSGMCFWISGVFWAAAILSGCEKKATEQTEFTKADSVTGTYLSLQDTMLQVWNTMIHDDNRKILAMDHLLDKLSVTNPEKSEELSNYQRLDELPGMRYDQQSISDPEVVTEYDFASNSLVAELIALAESQREFAYDKSLQTLVDSIRSADQRVLNYRAEYDQVASRFNRFVEQHHDLLEGLSADSFVARRPLFEMAAE